MGKYLNGSSKTGKKIIDNIKLFSYIKTEYENSDDSELYKFEWNFDGQEGYINIIVKEGRISNSSLMNTNNNTSRSFSRPLGLYNDSSLETIFTNMLESVGVIVSGVYVDPL